MTEDVYEPLARYRDEFRDRFAELTREKFRTLTEHSGIDVPACRELARTIRALMAKADKMRLRSMGFGYLTVLCVLVVLVAAVVGYAYQGEDPRILPCCVGGGVAGVVIGVLMWRKFCDVRTRLAELESEIATGKQAAWELMKPLNQLFRWDMTVKLIEETVPRLAFDPYFTVDRLEALHRQFGWDDAFNEGKSVIFAQSGVINGNPFVFGQYLDMKWGEKTYEGTKQISWTEWETVDGKRRRVTRHETLRAYVTKPIPVYGEHKLLLYGNDAAPNLSFTRKASGLTESQNGFFGKLKMKWRLRGLKAYSRNLEDESEFTLMANHEFETWFHAKDRDNEVEFRLLFTPIAQRQLLELMKDRTVGYGDDFSFVKQKKVNLLTSGHLDEGTINTDPAQFRNWDYDAAQEFFVAFNERYFKDVYFSLAPLLAIPAYQQVRTHEEIWKGVVESRPSSFWEHESLANYYGEDEFKHPQSVTRSILKTSVAKREDGDSTIAVTAHGYRGEDRVHTEEVKGGDGRWHAVDVHWTEYLPVSRTSEMCLRESDAPSPQFDASSSILRRSIRSYVRHCADAPAL